MKQHKDTIRLRHMLDAARKAVGFIRGKKQTDLETDDKLLLALIRLLEVIGEAAKNVSSECRQQHPDVVWKEIAGTRDRLIHGYFDVDSKIVWNIVSQDLPPLISHLENII